mmetsp:Transcript_29484/g.61744  ORF Transcript_29484/g.61744 Transcript_29484/m.61744 type:complete len:96 (+) Transcript_29484:117-404(+)
MQLWQRSIVAQHTPQTGRTLHEQILWDLRLHPKQCTLNLHRRRAAPTGLALGGLASSDSSKSSRSCLVVRRDHHPVDLTLTDDVAGRITAALSSC